MGLGGAVRARSAPSAQMLASRRPSRQRSAGSPASLPARTGVSRSRTAGSCAGAPRSPAGGPWDSAPRKPRPRHANDPPREHAVSVLAFLFYSLLSPQGPGARRGCFSHKCLYPCLHAPGFGVPEEPPESTCWAVGGSSGLLLGPVLAPPADWSSRSRTSGS